MIFHTFGNRDHQTIILIHGMLTPWQIWDSHIDFFKERYHVVVPALDAHIEESASEYISADDEAEQIEQYILSELQGEVFAVCGLSMGGVIANRLFERGHVAIQNLVLDGAPLIRISSLPNKYMAASYKSIIHKSKQRDPKVIKSFCKYFLPEKYLESYLKIADTMSDASIDNIMDAVCKTVLNPRRDMNRTKILFLHGTKGNEVYARRSAALMKKAYPEMHIQCFRGYQHAELAIYNSNEWLKTVDAFLSV